MDIQHLFQPFLSLLLLVPPFLRDSFPGSNTVGDLHPIVLLPGFSCSQLEARLTDAYTPSAPQCGAQKGKGWFRLWENRTALEDPSYWPCVAEQMRLVYDPIADDYHDAPGVETRVPFFGSTRGFRPYDDAPEYKDNVCMPRLVEALEGIGYREGETLFGAPYDFRYAPAPPGRPCRMFSQFVERLTRLVERASDKNQNKPVILMSHSFGGIFALEYLHRQPLPWRKRFVKHFIMASTGAGGFVTSMQRIVTDGPDPLSQLHVKRSFASSSSAIPSPKVFGSMPLVVTRDRNYSAREVADFFRAAGFPEADVRLYETRALPLTLGLRAPMVPMTCLNGVGVPTVEQLVYQEGSVDTVAPPEAVYGDGDGVVNLVSILALGTVLGDDPGQEYFKSVKMANVTHLGVVSDDVALKQAIALVLEANA